MWPAYAGQLCASHVGKWVKVRGDLCYLHHVQHSAGRGTTRVIVITPNGATRAVVLAPTDIVEKARRPAGRPGLKPERQRACS